MLLRSRSVALAGLKRTPRNANGISNAMMIALKISAANTALVGTAIFNGVSQGLQPLASEAHARGEEHEKHQILVKSIVTGIVLAKQ